MIDRSWGVWAERHALLVRTPGFALLFERYGAAPGQPAHGRVAVALSRVETGDETVIFDARALALFDVAGNRVVLKARDPEVGTDLVFDNDLDRELDLGRAELDMALTGEELVLGREGRPVERLSGDRLQLVLPSGRPATLGRCERIESVLPQPGYPADEDNIARCLQEWALGTGLYRSPDGIFRSFTIGTNRFSFGFSYGAVGEDDLFHCRAARSRATDTGVIFAPLLRLYARRDRLVIDAAQDFAAAAGEDLLPEPPEEPAEEARPEPTVPGPEYWSLCGADPDWLEIEAPAGGRYRLVRPVPENPALLEWFRYRDYAAAGLRPQ